MYISEKRFDSRKTSASEQSTFRQISDSDESLAIQVSSTRPTNGAHLRKGFLKLLTKQLDTERKNLSEDEINGIKAGMNVFLLHFPSGSVLPTDVFTFVRLPDCELQICRNVNLIFSYD